MSKEERKPYPRQRPTVSYDDSSSVERVVQEHPAYGKITLTHPSGGESEMFGSDIPHNNRVALRIDLAYEEVSFGTPFYSPARDGRVVELEMTAYQWAGLVSSHSGNGVPCTLRYITPKGTGNLPLIEGQNSNEKMANKEIEKSLQAMMKQHEAGVKALEALVAKGKANKGELVEALKAVQSIHRRLPDVTSFALETFKENSENIVAKAQAEVEATIQGIVVRTGMKALGMNPIGLEDKDGMGNS